MTSAAKGKPASLAPILLVYPIFFASGAAGLIYEVTWTRQLLYTFGASLYAITAVLSAFMAGLALGAWAIGRRSDRLRRALAVYGVLEIAIGACGMLMPALLDHVHKVDAWAYGLWGQQFSTLMTFRFILSMALMLVPTTLMGATLPVLSRFLVRSPDRVGLHVGGLYAINTLGAVSGAFAAGFILIGGIGLLATQWLAAGLNFGAGLLALVLTPLLDRTPPPVVESAPVGDRPPEEEGDSPPPEILPGDEATPGPSDSGRQDADRRSLAIWILATAFASGVVALAAQIVWNRMLVFNFEYLKNTTYAFSAMLTIFLAGLALGSAIIGPLVDRHGEPLRLYGILLTLIGMAVGASAVAAVYGTDSLMLADPYDPVTDELSWVLAVANIMLQTIGVLGVPTLLMGMAFPVAARVFARVGTIGGDVGLLYSFNTVGAIFGSLLAALVLIPAMGLTRSLLVLGGIDVVLGLATIVRSPEGRSRAWVLGPLSVASMFGVLWIVSGPQVGRLQRLDRGEAIRFYKEGSLATVSVVENVIGERTLYVDGVGVAGTDPILETDQKSLAHVPMMLLANPTSALTVGFGSGGASYSLLLHDRLERIDCVEICQTVFDAAPALAATNHRFYRDMTPLAFAESDPRYNIVLDDARAWLRYTDSKYDFIATDCTDLRYKSNANLYDVEYFRACRNRLTEDGIVVVWMPLGGLSEDVFKIALRTFYEVFPQMGIFYMNNESTHYILLVGWQDRIRLDFRQFELSLREADVKQDLSILRLDDPVKLLSCFITGGEALGKWLGEGPLNTEDHPLIEFESPKYGFGDRPLLDNLDRLMEIRVTPRQFIDPTSLTTDALEQLERYERALPLIIEGHAHYRNIEAEGIFEALEAAALAWSKALVLAPEDLSLRRMLQFPIVSKRMELEENNPLWAMLFGRVYMVQVGAFKQDLAYDALRRAERLLRAQRNLIGEGDTTAVDGQLSLVQEWLDQIRKGG